MVLKKSLAWASKKNILLFIFTSFLFAFQSLFAQDHTDAVKRKMLASLEKNSEMRYMISKSNVIFPDILKGNEEEMLSYIEKFSTKRRDYLIRMYSKGKNYLSKAEVILKKYNLPAELKILLALESAYNGNAVSKAGAVGYWQIMDEVAREYGIKYIAQRNKAERKKLLKLKGRKGEKQLKTIVKIKDDRKNFNLSTHAAARYLRDRRRNLDDNWLLVVASYNCGIGNVWNAMKRSGKSDPTFWDIKNYLPSETRAYVMNFITLNVIFANYEMFANKNLNFAPEKIMIPLDLGKKMNEASSAYTDR